MTHQATAQLPVDEIARAVSGAVTSVLSKITRDGNSDSDENDFQVPHPKKPKMGNKRK